MKTTTKITEITHKDIVDLLSTALYGSAFFDGFYDEYLYDTMRRDEDTCFEEKMATLLLNGENVYIFDGYAEDEDESYGNLKHTYDGDGMVYTLSLKDFEAGMAKCVDGTFEKNKGCESDEVQSLRTYMVHLMNEDGLDLDQFEAECILQVIVFGKLIYG